MKEEPVTAMSDDGMKRTLIARAEHEEYCGRDSYGRLLREATCRLSLPPTNATQPPDEEGLADALNGIRWASENSANDQQALARIRATLASIGRPVQAPESVKETP